MNQRRRFVRTAAAAAALSVLPALRGSPAFAAFSQPVVDVWKSPDCGCCHGWIEHLQAAGFTVRPRDTGNAAVRGRLGIPMRLGSCHTAQVGGYAVEGHVPAREIKRLLAEKPKAVGLAVPGMPIGSPGMEDGSRRDAYDVLLVRADGSTEVFASYARAA
mgnify:CR=1 FL=1